MKYKTQLNKQRHAFLLTFFDLPHRYEAKEVNGYMLVRQINNNVQPPEWQVAIYPKSNYLSLVETSADSATLFSARGADPEAHPATNPPLA